MKRILFLITIVTLSACNTETHNFTLKANIKGLKKGTVYLERDLDSTFLTLDSLVINGNSEFELHTNLEEPEVLYIRLNKNANEQVAAAFFAVEGVTEFNSTLKNFNFDAKIKGSKQHELLEEYMTTISKLNNRNLDQIKENFENRKSNDSIGNMSFQDYQNNLIKRKYSYTINFALNNKTSEIAPYLAVYEIPNTSTRYLDTIYNSLQDNLKTSLYGKKLKVIIDQRKAAPSNLE
ncbi:DUF4369 domain-containing protein [Geojedonia litorea]|uniref:DUF4369 domain-containing protein n=1 Tax=Geojedonia litorea TaxID=1268269 RepID=A0ABV9MYK4_9FLAO